MDRIPSQDGVRVRGNLGVIRRRDLVLGVVEGRTHPGGKNEDEGTRLRSKRVELD